MVIILMFEDLFIKIQNFFNFKKEKNMNIENNEYITKNFKLSEVTVSDLYPKIASEMILTEEQKNNIKELIINIIEPVREYLKEEVYILSGVRTDELNNLIHGSKTSDHLIGAAADITSKKIRKNIKQTAIDIWNLNLPIRQLIYYPNKNFIHISINTINKPIKHEFLCTFDSKTYLREMI